MKATRIAIILLGCFCIAAIAQAEVEDSGDKVGVTNTTEKNSKEKTSKEKTSKETDPKENSKEKDPKETNSKEKDPKETNSKEKDPNQTNSKEKDPNQTNSKEKDPNQTNSKEKNSKEKDSKEKDSKEKNSKEKNSKEKDSKEKNSKENNSKEKNSKEKEDNNEAEKGCPKIISRKQWGAKPAKGTIAPLQTLPAKYIFNYHSATPACKTKDACSAQVRSIQDQNMNQKKLQDIAYNFLVGGDGNIYEGRGWNKEGGHTVGFNRKSLAICFIGSLASGKPTKEAIDNVRKLITCGIAKGQIAKNYKLLGHRLGLGSGLGLGHIIDLHVKVKKRSHHSAKH